MRGEPSTSGRSPPTKSLIPSRQGNLLAPRSKREARRKNGRQLLAGENPEGGASFRQCTHLSAGADERGAQVSHVEVFLLRVAEAGIPDEGRRGGRRERAVQGVH